MKFLLNTPPLAFLGSVAFHAAAGGALAVLGGATGLPSPQAAPPSFVTFEATRAPQPPAEPERPIAVEPPIAIKPARPVRSAPPPAEPPPAPESPRAESPPASVPDVPSAPVPAVAAATAAADALDLGVIDDATPPARVHAAAAIAASARSAAPAAHAVDARASDLSRPPRLADGARWDCPFPAEAESEGIERAQAVLKVEIEASGRLKKIEVKADPGYGFGDAARRCAMRRRWVGRQDQRGVPASGEVTVVVQFERS